MFLPWSKPTVFVCHVPVNGQRQKWLREVLDAWFALGAAPQVLSPSSDPISFQRERRIEAEQKGGDFYILADDDCLPDVKNEDFIAQGMRVLKKHPEFAMLAPLPSNENIVEWTPDERLDHYKTANDEEVMEHTSVGGIRFCRKGALKIYPAMHRELPGYDWLHGDALRKAGKRVGYIRSLGFVHLGFGHSTVWHV